MTPVRLEPAALGLESSTLPLSHCISTLKRNELYTEWKCFYFCKVDITSLNLFSRRTKSLLWISNMDKTPSRWYILNTAMQSDQGLNRSLDGYTHPIWRPSWLFYNNPLILIASENSYYSLGVSNSAVPELCSTINKNYSNCPMNYWININRLTFSKKRHDVKQCNGVSLDLAYQLCYSRGYNSIIRVHTVLILHQTFWQLPWS